MYRMAELTLARRSRMSFRICTWVVTSRDVRRLVRDHEGGVASQGHGDDHRSASRHSVRGADRGHLAGLRDAHELEQVQNLPPGLLFQGLHESGRRGMNMRTVQEAPGSVLRFTHEAAALPRRRSGRCPLRRGTPSARVGRPPPPPAPAPRPSLILVHERPVLLRGRHPERQADGVRLQGHWPGVVGPRPSGCGTGRTPASRVLREGRVGERLPLASRACFVEDTSSRFIRLMNHRLPTRRRSPSRSGSPRVSPSSSASNRWRSRRPCPRTSRSRRQPPGGARGPAGSTAATICSNRLRFSGPSSLRERMPSQICLRRG